MLKKLRRKVYRKIRFQTWYRKAYYYHRKRRDLDKTIAQYRGVDVLSDKKRLYRLRRDMIRSLFRYGSYYNEYFLFGYEGKDAAYRDSFITEGVRMSYYPRMNDPKNTNLLENKYLTYQKFRDFYGRDVLRIKKGAQPTPAALEALRSVDAQVEKASPLAAKLAAGKEAEGRVECRLADLIDAEPEIEGLVEKFLGDDLAALVVADAQDAATLAAAKDLQFSRIVCVFQPHRYSRTQALADKFAHAFKDVDVLRVMDVFSAGEMPIPGISGKTISSGVAAAGEVADVEYVPNRRKLVEELVDLVRPGDLLITQGAGDVTQIGPLFIEAMRERAAKE